MALIRLQNISVGFGGAPLLDEVDLNLDNNERVCLVGRNGEGKSTLLRVINGTIAADSGEISRRQGVKVAQLEQEVPTDLCGTIKAIAMASLGEIGALVEAYYQVIETGESLDKLDKLQTRIDALDGWGVELQVDTVLSRLQLDGNIRFETLSGGLKRRTLLARALVSQPDILLLDEPTNHLDIEAINWLEKFLRDFKGSLLFITHDRAFLRRLATRIVEIDRGRITSWPGDYDNFLVKKQAALDAEGKQQAEFDKKLAREEVWIRQGIKARRTRNEGRVRDLEKLRVQRAQRRERTGTATITAQQGNKSGKIVIETNSLGFAIGDNVLVDDFSTTILRDDKVGIIGPNGAGKTMLINLLLGKLKPDVGTIKLGTNIEIAYFDQMRAQLDPNQTAQDNVGGGSETVTINGKPKHIISYMQDFLFSPKRARSPIKALSGGERNRLLLAKLFTQPSNLLVMDEPTNDLDIETLELLEEQLLNYQGTLLLVSHDREFIDNIVTSTLVLEGEGKIGDYVGGYSHWLSRQVATPSVQAAMTPTSAPKSAIQPQQKPPVKKRSYKAQHELDELPGKIERAENEKAALEAKMSQADFYQQSAEAAACVQQRYSDLGGELEQLYARWGELEG